MKAGLLMNVVCVLTICLAINTYAVPLFNLNKFPDWARDTFFSYLVLHENLVLH